MRFEIKGDYFNGQFNLQAKPGSLTGREACDEVIEKFSPANLEDMLWVCPVDYRHIDAIVESAQKGFHYWKKISFEERSNYLKKYQECLLTRKNKIATAISLETGKPLWESHTEVDAVIAKIDITINESLKRIQTLTFKNIMPDTTGEVHHRPIGPCLIIGPFNFPCHLANGQIVSALLAGNSIIFKPSEKTIYSAQLLIECFHEAGFPNNVINFINGSGEVAKRIIKEKSIKGIYFTGSKEVGKSILELTHQDLTKLVALELGGKNTSIVHCDANLDHALAELIKACFLTSGQRCVSTSKIAVHASIKDELVDRFHQLAKRIIIDHPIEFEQEPFMGPLIDKKSLENYLVYMGMAKREGFDEIMRGKQLEKKFQGYYVSPSIHYIDSMKDEGHFLGSEIFGPNCVFLPYNDIEQAIKITNASEYGLATGVFTSDDKIFRHCLEEIDSGIINLNRATAGASSKLPFGGVKNSGNYRPAGVSMIDSCVHPVSSLLLEAQQKVDFNKITGIQ